MIIILGAMDSEIDEFLSRLEQRQALHWNGFTQHRGQLEGQEVLVSKSGVGKVMSAMVTQHLIDRWQPSAVIFTGLAGSLQPHIEIGDTLLAADLVQHDLESTALNLPRGQVPFSDYRFLPSDPILLELAAGFRPATGQLHQGRICTGDQFITNRTELDTIKQRFPDGLAVDMESAAIAQTCYLYNVPFLSFRIISDTPGVEDHASQYADFWGTMAERSFLTIWTFLSTLPSNL